VRCPTLGACKVANPHQAKPHQVKDSPLASFGYPWVASAEAQGI